VRIHAIDLMSLQSNNLDLQTDLASVARSGPALAASGPSLPVESAAG
jgi:hypothetical protein